MTTLSTTGSALLYLSIFGLSSLCIAWKDRVTIGNRKKPMIFIVFGLILPVLLAAYRVNVGSDYSNYLWTYKRVSSFSISQFTSNYSFISSTPIGMILVAKLASIFGSEKVFFGMLAVLSLLPFLIFICKNEDIEHKGIATFLYLLTNFSTGFNTTKQIIAINIVLLGLEAVYHRKLIRFILAIICAAFFHQTAIVAFPIYFLLDKNGSISTGKRLVAIIVAFIGLVLFDNILVSLGGRWADYADSSGTSNLTFFLNFGWLIIFLLCRRPFTQKSYRNELSLILFVVGTIFTLLGFWSVFGKRIASYYTVVEILLMAQLPDIVSKNSKRGVEILVVIYAVAMFILSAVIRGQSGLIPYSF